MTKVPGMPLSSTIALVIEMVIFGAMLIGVVAASLLLSENVVADQVSMTVMLLQPGAQGCTVAFVRR